MIAAIATIAGKKVLRSLRSYGNHSSAFVAIVATTIAEIDFSSIPTMVAIVAIMWKPLSKDCSDHCDEKYNRIQYVVVCSRSPRSFFLFCSDRSHHMELVVVRIAQRYCSDGSDHMETSL